MSAQPRCDASEVLFYDGQCGLCHRAVRFVLKHDRAGTAFRFAPLQGETFLATVPAELRTRLSDSMVVRRCDGALLVRSDAVVHILRRLGGGWRAIATLLEAVPRPFQDCAYDVIARIRHRLFRPPRDLCPGLPPDLAGRFDP